MVAPRCSRKRCTKDSTNCVSTIWDRHKAEAEQTDGPRSSQPRARRATSQAQARQPRPPQAPAVLLQHYHASSLIYQVVPAATCPSLTAWDSKLRSLQIPACFAQIPETPRSFLQSLWFPACPDTQHLGLQSSAKASAYAWLWGRAVWEIQGFPSSPHAHPPAL